MNMPRDTITDKGIFLTYEKYQSWISTDPLWRQKAGKMTSVWIYNPEGILIMRGNDLPMDGIRFEHPENLAFFKEAKEIFLGSLHIDDIPDSFVTLQSLEKMEIAFTAHANLKHAVEVLSKLKSLKELNIDASTLPTRDRKAFILAMEKKGIVFTGIIN